MAVDQRIMPNQSLYIQNLPEKLQKEDLRRELYILFSTYGPVLDITALKTSRMRGQAHVLFRDMQAATQAMRACQGFEFFGRQMRINYSKSTSKTIAKLTGGVNVPDQTAQQQAAKQTTSFPAPGAPGAPGVLSGPLSSLPPPPKLNGQALAPPSAAPVDAPSPQGVKRQREETDGEAPMDEDSDGEGEMDMSDDD